MQSGNRRPRRLDAILDALASRIGLVSVVGLLVAICIGAGFATQTVVTQLQQNHTVFRDRQARNGYVAMSDIQRMILVVQRALDEDGMTEALAAEFRDAADILYVRTDNFGRILKREETALPSGAEAIRTLYEIIDIADLAIAQKFPDVRGLLETLLAANDEARTHLVQFLDDMRREAEEVLETQSRAVRNQQVVVIANLAGLTLIGSVALFLLRLEVLGRRAREIAEERVEYLAYFDPLTGLPNRGQFQDRLRDLLPTNRPSALIYVDLDDFKLINDTYGHSAGDAVLRHVGRVLTVIAAREDGFAARLGGDEFALVLPGDNLPVLTRLCEEIIDTTAEPFWFEGASFVVGVSLGLATTTQARSNGDATIDMLCRVTDFALYNSKATGRKRYTVYDKQIEQRFWARRALVEELPRAIEDGDLEVHMQPKVLLPDGKVYGFESVVRWRREGRLVPPSEFITIAEESGLVLEIDHFVLSRSARLIADWNAEHGTEFSISVNLSTLHFNSPRVCMRVEDALWKAGLPARLLTLEITETTEMRDWKQAREILDDLKRTGCKIAIDDFGTGFSSLAYLRAMQANELKIDRSLVQELEDSNKARLLLSSVLEIARNLELSVTIEGIETEEQARIVHEMGAIAAQGFLFGRPLPAHEALAAATPRAGRRYSRAIG